MASGIFVSYRGYLEGPRGGVQVCTQEYIEVIKAAGVDLRFCPFEGDRRLSTRILRRLVSSGYFRPAEPAVLKRMARLVAERRPDFVFLNQVALAPLAREIRELIPSDLQDHRAFARARKHGSTAPQSAASPFSTERAGAAGPCDCPRSSNPL